MASLILSFAFKEKQFSLCATIKGTEKRNYKKVTKLINPDYQYWDKRTQRFEQATDDAMYNNRILSEIMSHYQGLINEYDPPTGKQLFELSQSSIKIAEPIKADKAKENKPTSLGEYVNSIIIDMKNESVKAPSKNYQAYITLLNKLYIEGELLHVPLSEVTDDHFIKFCDFIKTKFNGSNYIGLTKRFHAVINRANRKRLNKHSLTYQYIDEAPINKNDIQKVKDGVNALSTEQYQRFVDMDLNIIQHGGGKAMLYKELYRDFCIFLYEMKMRPCDVIYLNKSDIVDKYGNKYIQYIPAKKKNYRDIGNAIVREPITQKADDIIKKYSGQSSKGFIFPFAMNNHDWDLLDAVSFNKWYNRKQATQEKINAFLAKVQKELDIDKLTIYTFRRSTFTHEINANKKSLLQIAKEGGTSVSMLEKHYYNNMVM